VIVDLDGDGDGDVAGCTLSGNVSSASAPGAYCSHAGSRPRHTSPSPTTHTSRSTSTPIRAPAGQALARSRRGQPHAGALVDTSSARADRQRDLAPFAGGERARM